MPEVITTSRITTPRLSSTDKKSQEVTMTERRKGLVLPTLKSQEFYRQKITEVADGDGNTQRVPDIDLKNRRGEDIAEPSTGRRTSTYTIAEPNRSKSPRAKELRMITEEELEQHNTPDDCWMVVHDMVVHLKPDFLSEHPGGPDVVSCMAGKVASQDFEDIAHSDTARDWASKFIIGYYEFAANPETAKFKTRLKRLDEVEGDSLYDSSKFIQIAMLLIVLVVVASAIFGK